MCFSRKALHNSANWLHDSHILKRLVSIAKFLSNQFPFSPILTNDKFISGSLYTANILNRIFGSRNIAIEIIGIGFCKFSPKEKNHR